MKVDINEVIENMKRWGKKVISLGNGWNIKQIDNFREFEVFNDKENQFYNCPSIENLKKIIEMIKD